MDEILRSIKYVEIEILFTTKFHSVAYFIMLRNIICIRLKIRKEFFCGCTVNRYV